MMKKSAQCPTAPDKITATSIIHGIGPQKYDRNFSNGFVLCSTISFGPYCSRRFAASACVSPSGDDSSFFWTSAIGSDLRSCSGSGFDVSEPPGVGSVGVDLGVLVLSVLMK